MLFEVVFFGVTLYFTVSNLVLSSKVNHQNEKIEELERSIESMLPKNQPPSYQEMENISN